MGHKVLIDVIGVHVDTMFIADSMRVEVHCWLLVWVDHASGSRFLGVIGDFNPIGPREGFLPRGSGFVPTATEGYESQDGKKVVHGFLGFVRGFDLSNHLVVLSKSPEVFIGTLGPLKSFKPRFGLLGELNGLEPQQVILRVIPTGATC